MSFKTATAAAYRQLLIVRGVDLVYSRGADSVALTGIPGEIEFSRESGDGLTVLERVKDFLIPVSVLILDSVLVTPEPGDGILWSGVDYEVASPGGSSPAWVQAAHDNHFFQIHTREA